MTCDERPTMTTDPEAYRKLCLELLAERHTHHHTAAARWTMAAWTEDEQSAHRAQLTAELNAVDAYTTERTRARLVIVRPAVDTEDVDTYLVERFCKGDQAYTVGDLNELAFAAALTYMVENRYAPGIMAERLEVTPTTIARRIGATA